MINQKYEVYRVTVFEVLSLRYSLTGQMVNTSNILADPHHGGSGECSIQPKQFGDNAQQIVHFLWIMYSGEMKNGRSKTGFSVAWSFRIV